MVKLTTMPTVRLKRATLAAVFALPLPLIAIVAALNPSGAPPPWLLPLLPSILLIGSAFIAVFIAFYRLQQPAGHLKETFLELLLFLGLIFGIAILLASLVHRDFYSAPFQFFLAYSYLRLPLLLNAYPFRGLADKRTPPAKLRASYGAFAAVTFIWVCLMAYCVAARQEPRWAESLFYNAYNTLMVMLFLIAFLRMDDSGTVRLIVSTAGTELDGRDISKLFGAQGVQLLRKFLSGNNRIHCSDYIGCKRQENCKYSSCKEYRKTYNAVLMVRNVLEAMDLGTIESLSQSSGQPAGIWILQLDKRVHCRRLESED